MNNNYFYKLASVADRIDWMRKVAQSTGSTTQKPTGTSITTTNAPSTPSPTAPTTSTSGVATQTTPVPASRPTPVRSPGPGDEKFVPKNATDLYNHWVKQKENFYRKRAEDPNDKFGSRYANYTVSREAQKGLEREAKDLFDRFNRGDIDQAELERYFTREGAFNSAMDRYQQERIDRKNQQEQAAGAPMQNPTATSAIQNPQVSIGTGETGFNQILSGGYKAYYDNMIPHPGFDSPFYGQYQAGYDAFKSQLRPLFPAGVPDYQLPEQFYNFHNAAEPGHIGGNDFPMTREMYSDPNPAVKKFITKDGNNLYTIAELAQKAGRQNDLGYKAPPGLERYWNYLLNIYNMYYNQNKLQ